MSARYHTPKGGAHRVLLRWVIFLLLATLTVVPARAAHNSLGARVVAASPENTVVVTTTSDHRDDDADTSSLAALNSQPGADGAISLREALVAANTTPTTTLDLTISFSIPITDTGYSYDIANSSDTWTIQVGLEDFIGLPALSRGNVRIDGSTQPGDGAGPHIILDGYYDGDMPTNGLNITSAHNVVRGLALVSFYDNGIAISGSAAANNQIAGCYIYARDLSTWRNGNGVSLTDGAHGNTIGGYTVADRNLISGNDAAGVLIAGATTTNNTVAGNWIGLDATGLAALPNVGPGVSIIGGAHDNMIGGATGRNYISGNHYGGVTIQGTATMSNTVAGNWIGVDTTGQAKVGNDIAGVVIDAAQHNLIGGTWQGNLIAGNEAGVDILVGIANRVAGNTIGLAVDGVTRLGNRDAGIYIRGDTRGGARDNIVGGTTAGDRNVIAGDASWATNYGYGIYVYGAGTTHNTIQGNYIGVTTSGNLPAGHRREGVLIGGGAHANTIGGITPSAGNVIANNGLGGISLSSTYNLVAHNLIGWGANGVTQIGNQSSGIRIWNYNNNVIGPDNRIANNSYSGIMFSGSNTTIISNTIDHNQRSGICAAGASAIIKFNEITHNGGIDGDYPPCNIQGGIVITNTIGTQVISNWILDNTGAGITVHVGTENSILNNSISGNDDGIVLLEGANENIAPPAISHAIPSEVSGVSCAFCHVQIFTDDGDQGRNFIKATTALFDGSFVVPLVPGTLDPPHVTATTTDANGNTSPFAPPKDVTTEPPPPPLKKVFLPIVRVR